MKKSIFAVSVAALFFTACSNSEDFETPQSQKEIALNPVAQKATRAPISGTSFDDGQKIYVSAWNSVSGDYFKNIEFEKSTESSSTESSETPWKAGKLWPINGITSFLAYAFNQKADDSETGYTYSDVDVNSKATWGENNKDYAKKLTFDFSDNSLCYKKANENGTSVSSLTPTPYVDLLYANADQAKEKDYSTVSMTFKHTGAWIVFNVRLADNLSDASLIINNFSLLNVYKSGKLTIDNTIAGGAKASWDFTGLTADEYQVESFPQANSNTTDKGLTLSTTDKTFGVVLPEQQQTAIQFKYTLLSTNSAFNAQTATYTHNLDRFNKWEMGKKYEYTIKISFKEIEISPSVTIWDTSNNTEVDIPDTYNPGTN